MGEQAKKAESTEEKRVPAIMVPLFGAYTVISVAGLLLLRRWLPTARVAIADGEFFSRTTGMAALGAAAYITSFLLWMVIVAQVPVSRAYPVSVGLTLTFTVFGAWLLLGEKLTVQQVAGTVVIFVGVLLVSLPARYR